MQENIDLGDKTAFILDEEKDIDLESLSIIEIEEKRREIYEELDIIDKKSVRALRENNETLLTKYEKRAQELRAELRKFSE